MRQILDELIATSVVGAMARSPMGVLEGEPWERIRAEPDQHRRLALLAHLTRVVLERAGPVHAVIRSAAATDPEVAAIRLQQQALRLRGQTEFVRVLTEAGPLRDGLSIEEGGYHYWILATPELQHILVVEQGWSHDRYEEWLRTSLAAVLLPPEDEGVDMTTRQSAYAKDQTVAETVALATTDCPSGVYNNCGEDSVHDNARPIRTRRRIRRGRGFRCARRSEAENAP